MKNLNFAYKDENYIVDEFKLDLEDNLKAILVTTEDSTVINIVDKYGTTVLTLAGNDVYVVDTWEWGNG